MFAHKHRLTAARLEPLHYHTHVRQSLNSDERGDRGTTFGRVILQADDAPLLDAANPYGFAACAVTAALAELYTAANYCH